MARVLAAEMSRRTGQSVVVDNRAGAEGQIGAQAAATAAPDGYTIFVTTQTTQAINQHVYKSLPYDPVKSFAPISALPLEREIAPAPPNTSPCTAFGSMMPNCKSSGPP